ncbi:uncharacterized protein VTP21DRAFT_10415 [Calcarisporiella thermophila]|uniref:uncharacterized protein n=1 Tax=Calcarisporiella thermophila TaxID=911321 RepID=UPI003743B711
MSSVVGVSGYSHPPAMKQGEDFKLARPRRKTKSLFHNVAKTSLSEAESEPRTHTRQQSLPINFHPSISNNTYALLDYLGSAEPGDENRISSSLCLSDSTMVNPSNQPLGRRIRRKYRGMRRIYSPPTSPSSILQNLTAKPVFSPSQSTSPTIFSTRSLPSSPSAVALSDGAEWSLKEEDDVKSLGKPNPPDQSKQDSGIAISVDRSQNSVPEGEDSLSSSMEKDSNANVKENIEHKPQTEDENKQEKSALDDIRRALYTPGFSHSSSHKLEHFKTPKSPSKKRPWLDQQREIGRPLKFSASGLNMASGSPATPSSTAMHRNDTQKPTMPIHRTVDDNVLASGDIFNSNANAKRENAATISEQASSLPVEKQTNASDLPAVGRLPSSLWDYLRYELTASDFDATQELKRERITNFMAVPRALDKLIFFGYFICLDSFLYTFTILPARFAIALWAYIKNIWDWIVPGRERSPFKFSQKCDLLKGLLLILCCLWCLRYLDPSLAYHSIRGQDVIKLYVIFNVLEIFDRLCSSFGGDILDALFSESTLCGPLSESATHAHLKPITFFILAFGYVLAHTTVLFYQVITLHVAINSFSNALLSLLISNQFVEIKGSVFKKFEKENLFQLSCSDIVERFQQSIFLAIITLRNTVYLSGSPISSMSILPSAFRPLLSSKFNLGSLETLMTPIVMVVTSEILVDWLKHAFITKFNQIRPTVYEKFMDVLCRDLVVGSPGRIGDQKKTFVDQSPVVSRRIGFAPIPLACLVIRIILHTYFSAESVSLTEDSTSPIPTFAFSFEEIWRGLAHGGITGAVRALLNFDFLSPIRNIWWSQKAIEAGVWILLLTVVYACLIALKLLVGVNLLGYAYRRYGCISERESLDRRREQERQERGVEKAEQNYRQSLRSYLDDPRDNLLTQHRIQLSLDNLDRYTLFKSRIP